MSDDAETKVKQDDDSGDDSDEKEDMKECADIRDIRYNLETLWWEFDPDNNTHNYNFILHIYGCQHPCH